MLLSALTVSISLKLKLIVVFAEAVSLNKTRLKLTKSAEFRKILLLYFSSKILQRSKITLNAAKLKRFGGGASFK